MHLALRLVDVVAVRDAGVLADALVEVVGSSEAWLSVGEFLECGDVPLP